jgi:hypothetical protein
MLDLIKNPIIIALFAGVLTYIYMVWSNENKNKNRKDAPIKKPVNLIIPLVVTVIVWVLAHGYFVTSKSEDELISVPTNNLITNSIKPIMGSGYKLVGGNNVMMTGGGNIQNLTSESASPLSYQLINKGLNIPNNLNIPDVFIETLN